MNNIIIIQTKTTVLKVSLYWFLYIKPDCVGQKRLNVWLSNADSNEVWEIHMVS